LRTVLIIILVVYNSSLINVVNVEVSKVLNIPVVKLIFVIVVVMFAIRDPVLAILLAMALVISVCTKHNVEGMENQQDQNDDHQQQHHQEEEHHQPQHHSEEEHHQQHENFDNPVEPGVAQGYNIHPDCVSGCCDENKERSELCNSVKTFQNEQNAQGMNCPQGYDGKVPGSPW